MYTYFDTVPAAAVHAMPDGRLYAHSDKKLSLPPGGRIHVSAGVKPRLLRVSSLTDGVAQVPLGMAGDSIAETRNLPVGVVFTHSADAQLAREAQGATS